jgi:hypothetical protein
MEETVQGQWRAIVDFVQPGGAHGAGVSQFCQECLGYLGGAGATVPHARPALHQFGWHECRSTFRSCAGRASPLAPTVLLAPNLTPRSTKGGSPPPARRC